MSVAETPTGEIAVTPDLVGGLVGDQFPGWAALPLTPFQSEGTDNAVYRLGDTMMVRLPRTPKASWQVEKEQTWLPVLQPELPLAVPTLLGAGQPDTNYPWRWSVYNWLPGRIATTDQIPDTRQAARDLGGFLVALQSISSEGGPEPGDHNFHRGEPLAARDADVQAALAALSEYEIIDTKKASAAWDSALQTPSLVSPPTWIHGDLADSNMLACEGRISAVIDFGGLCVGDPACDLLVAWDLLAPAQDTFRDTVRPDDAAWDRGRGWALATGLIALSRFVESRPSIAEVARQKVETVLADHAQRSHLFTPDTFEVA